MKEKNQELKDIIEFAIENEVETYEFYRDAAVKVDKPELKGILEELAQEELEHKKFLEDFVASDVATIDLDPGVDYKVAETIEKQKLSVDMSFSDALGLAIKMEQEAMDMYTNLAESCVNPVEKELFEGLATMEKLHKTRLEEIYLNTAYAEAW